MSDASMQEELARLAGRVDHLTAQVARVERDVQDIGAATTTISGAYGADTHGADIGEQVYDSVQQWVHGYYIPTFIRPIGGDIRWCTKWQRHPEAVVRFEAMWRSWESLRLEGSLGMSTWLINYFDPNAVTLLGRTGPFAQCTPSRHLDGGGGE